jgi:hypothetical protein
MLIFIICKGNTFLSEKKMQLKKGHIINTTPAVAGAQVL